MNCWEILGIEPTGDRRQIQQAYEQQMKFASGEEAEKLQQAFRQATGEVPDELATAADAPEEVSPESATPEPQLDGNDGQIVREVVIQIKALLNDSGRSADAGIWKAILCEPPADKPPIRREIASQLEPQVRPMAENGSLSLPVAQFLGEWFDWRSLKDVAEPADIRNYPEPEDAASGEEESPQMVNFWPAVVGWIVALVILSVLFGGMGGN